MNTYALIPARGGSKSIPKKNIMDLGGFPLIAYSIIAAKLSTRIDRIIVSTDSEEIAEVARRFGAEVPFMRPAEISEDLSTDREFAVHALEWLREHEGVVPEYLVHFRPTTPLRHPRHIDEAITLMKKHSDATSLRSAHEILHTPQKWFNLNGPYFEGLFPHDSRPEYHNLPRQSFAPAYKPNGYVDVLKSSVILRSVAFHGDRILAYIAPDTGDIDHLADADFARSQLENGQWEIYAYLTKNYPESETVPAFP